MAVDTFNLAQFEAALPKAKPVGDAPGAKLFKHIGLVMGEHCFVFQPFPSIPLSLFIRSSIDTTGWSAEAGEDSIRVRICEAKEPYEFVGNKANCWTNRTAGWGERTKELLKKLMHAINFSRPCPKCGNRLTPCTTKTKMNGNAGRTFVSCDHCLNHERKSTVFYWCEDKEGKQLPVPADLLPQPPKTPAPVATTNKPTQCPKCNKFAVELSKIPANGSHYCFPRNGGCRLSFTPGEVQAPPTTPKPVAKPQPPTLAALVEAVQTMIDTLHKGEANELPALLRSHPDCAAVARMVQAFHNSQE